jgi:hypothetical protein
LEGYMGNIGHAGWGKDRGHIANTLVRGGRLTI